MRTRRTLRAGAVVAAAALVGLVGYATAGLAASQSSAKITPLTADQLSRAQSDLRTAITLELRAIADLKKGTPAAEKDLLVSLRRAKTDLADASTIIVTSGFRSEPSPFNPISNAGNAIKVAYSYQPSKGALSTYRVASTRSLLKSAISLETKALALLPPLAVAPTTSTGTTTAPTTTG